MINNLNSHLLHMLRNINRNLIYWWQSIHFSIVCEKERSIFILFSHDRHLLFSTKSCEKLFSIVGRSPLSKSCIRYSRQDNLFTIAFVECFLICKVFYIYIFPRLSLIYYWSIHMFHTHASIENFEMLRRYLY